MKRALTLLVVLAALTLSGCESTNYGRGGVPVSINVEITEPVPASSEDDAPKTPKIQGWVLDLNDWATLKGTDQFAELNRLGRLKDSDAKAAKGYDDLRNKLIESMDKDRVTTFRSTKSEKRRPKDTLWLVVDYREQLTYDKFDTVLQRSVTIRI